MANNRALLHVSYYGYDRFKDGAPTEMRIEFQRLCSRDKISKLAADLISMAVDFNFDPRTGEERGPAIRMGWYSPKVAEIVEVLTAHGFVVKQEITVNLGAAGALYKKLCEATEGYAGAVPIIHQAVAVKAAIDALDMAFQEDRDANF